MLLRSGLGIGALGLNAVLADDDGSNHAATGPHFGGKAKRVIQFFLNGGQQAYIIRLVQKTGGGKATLGTVSFDGLDIEATGEGQWSKDYTITINLTMSD